MIPNHHGEICKDKYDMLLLGRRNQMHRYKIRSDWPASSSAGRDMGDKVDHKWHESRGFCEKGTL